VYLGLGDNERAIQAFQVSLDEPNEVVMWLKVMPYFHPIRSDPRYITMFEEAGAGEIAALVGLVTPYSDSYRVILTSACEAGLSVPSCNAFTPSADLRCRS
jgi:hypothetical protein